MKPDAPLYATDDFSPDAIDDPVSRKLACDLRQTGYGVMDLGPEALCLCDKAVADVEPLFRPGVKRVQDAWLRSKAVRQLALFPAIHKRLADAYGRRPFAFQTLNFREGSQQRAHSDTIHFNSQPEDFMCGVWIALEDVQEDAGPLLYYERSDRLPRITMAEVGAGNTGRANYQAYEDHIDEALQRSNLPRRHAIVPKGHAFVWSANLAHGGSPIARPGLTRRSLVVHFHFDDCLYYTPVFSDEPRDKLYVRLPLDIAGGVRWPHRNGRPTMPSPRALAASLFRLVTRT